MKSIRSTFPDLLYQPAGITFIRAETGRKFTCTQILETLQEMQITLLTIDCCYIPSYQRTVLTDKLHEAFGFRTNYEFMAKSAMRNIISKAKKQQVQKNGTYRYKRRNRCKAHKQRI